MKCPKCNYSTIFDKEMCPNCGHVFYGSAAASTNGATGGNEEHNRKTKFEGRGVKRANIVLLFLLVMRFGPAFTDIKFWKSGWTPLIFIGVILVPGTFLLVSYMRQRAPTRSVPRILAAIYNCAAALILVWHGVTMNVSEMHPVAIAITEQLGSLIIAVLAALNAWRLMAQHVSLDGTKVPTDYISKGKTSSKAAFISLAAGLVCVFFTPLAVVSVVAIFYGHRALRELHSNPDLRGRGAAYVGLVTGYLGLLSGIVELVLLFTGRDHIGF
ncbi:MAG: hypothetical protein HW412_2658 [Bacteroidetes bacterium]|nr:hypothetical protein [Bacteroidota bacterium]